MEETNYTDEEMAEVGKFIVDRLADEFGNNPMKLYLLEEVTEGLMRGDDVRDELVKLFEDTIMHALIDATLELDEEE